MKFNRFRTLAAALTVCLCATFAVSQTVKPVHHGGPAEHMLGYYTDMLDLTDAQQTQIKAIMTKEKATFEPLMEQLRQTHSQMRQFEEAATFDEAKVRTTAAQQSQTMIDLAVEKARMKNEMFQVLTADQKAKLQKMEARHEQHFQNHEEGQPPVE
jgi:periplasmic protein CpxP/Spy